MKQPLGLIHLRPKASSCLAGFILVSHLLGAIALFLSDIHDMLRILLLVIILLDCYFLWNRLVARSSARDILRADWLSDDRWQIEDGKGRVQQATSWILLLNTPALVMLKFKLKNNKAATLIICPDSVDREVGRQLRVRLNTS